MKRRKRNSNGKHFAQFSELESMKGYFTGGAKSIV